MALIRRMARITKEKQSIHDETDCCYSIVTDANGAKVIQLDTFGSKDRQIPGKVSQSLQLDRDAALQLAAIIEEVFH